MRLKVRIGIDIDGVLLNMGQFVLDYGSKFCYEHNLDFEIQDGEYDERKAFGLSEEEAEKFWNEYLVKYIESMPRECTKEVIDILKENHEIYIITARDEYGLPQEYYGSMQKLTKKWLEENKIYYDKLIFSSEGKLDVCQENKIDVMIEDSPNNIEKLSKGDLQVFCYDSSYNKKANGNNVIRVYSWYDILNKIQKIYKLNKQ